MIELQLLSSFLPTYSIRMALILFQLTIKYGGVMQDRMYQMPAEDVANLQQHLIDAHCKALLTVLLMYGIRDFRPLWMEKEAS